MSEPTDYLPSPGCFQQPAWGEVAKWASLEIDRLHVQNEGPLAPDQTATNRGAIRQLRALLALPEQAAQQRPEPIHY